MKFIASIDTVIYGVPYLQGAAIDVTGWSRKQELQFLGNGLISPSQISSIDLALAVAIVGAGVTTVVDPVTDKTTVTVPPAVQVAQPLDWLTDVDTVAVPPTNGQTLVFDSVSGLWKPGTIAGGGGGSPTGLSYPFTRTWTTDKADGIMGWLGTAGATKAFACPALASGGASQVPDVLFVSAAAVTAAQSTDQDGGRTADKALDHSLDGNVGCSHTQNGVNQWWRLDFGATKTVTLTRFGIVGRYGGTHPSQWKLQGSADAAAWTDLTAVIAGGPTDGTWYSVAVVGAAAYRYVRLLQTIGNYLVLGEVEMWGTVTGP